MLITFYINISPFSGEIFINFHVSVYGQYIIDYFDPLNSEDLKFLQIEIQFLTLENFRNGARPIIRISFAEVFISF